MDLTLNQVVHSLISLIKYVVALTLIVLAAKFLLPMWGSTCVIDSEDMGMRDALGKTRLKLSYNPRTWSEAALKRKDIVIVKMEVAAVSGEEREWRKFPYRVVAVEGDIIQAPRGIFTINGKEESYTGVNIQPSESHRMPQQRMPRGYLYVLPDDRVSCKGGLPMMIPAWRIVGKVEKL